MRRRHIVVAIALVTVGVGSFVGGRASVTSTGHPMQPLTSALPRVINCASAAGPSFEPRTFFVACGDGNAFVSSITWCSWSTTSAHGHGTLGTNACRPDCAAGTFEGSPTDVSLTAPVATSDDGPLFSVAEIGSTTMELPREVTDLGGVSSGLQLPPHSKSGAPSGVRAPSNS